MRSPLRIAVFTNTFPSVSETFISRQIGGLLDSGHRVHVYADVRPGAGSWQRSEGSTESRRVRVTYFNMPEASGYWEMPVLPLWGRTWLPESAAPVPNARRMLDAAPAILRCFLLAPRTSLKALNPAEYGYRARSLSTLYRVSQLLRSGASFDIAHAHFGPVGDNVRFVRELWNVPLVVSFHGYDTGAWPREKGQDVYNNLFRTADVITANSRYTADRLVTLGCPRHKISTLHMGLDLTKFAFKAFRERTMPPDERLRLLSVGRLVEKKGFEYSIRALARIRETRPCVSYSIVGDGPLRSHLESVACELGVGEAVTFHGAGSEELVRQKMAEATIFLVPSVTAENGDTEGQGLVLQEAQACGIPVLATAHNGLPEGMLDERSGFLVPERDVNALTERLAYMLEHQEMWPEWGRQGRKHIEEHYDIRKLNRQLEHLYRQAIHRYRGRYRVGAARL